MQTLPLILWSPPCDIAKQDCACPDSGLAPASNTTSGPLTPWHRPDQLYRAPLPKQHELIYNPTSHAGAVVLNRPARQILDAFATPRTPTQAAATLPELPPDQVYRAAHQLATLDLLDEWRAPNHVSRITYHVLTAWLHVTDACNLRCTYCYLHKSGEKMDLATGRTTVEAVFHSALLHQFRAVKLKYAGGEPTLNFGLVRTLHAHARHMAEQTGLTLREVLLSNGVSLSDEILDWLFAEDVRLMISLDGVGAVHDAQRVFANGRGSFDRVARGIDRALTRGVRPYLSITVTACSADGLAEAVAFALDRDLLFNLNFCRENALMAPHSDLQAKDRRLIDGVRRAFALIEERLPQQSLIGALVDRASFGVPHRYPCGVGRNYLVIDQRGRVARCQMEIERPVTDVWADDPLAAIRADGADFNPSVQEKDDCRACQWRNWCAGGCPLLTRRVSGQNGAKSPYCTVYKALFPEALRLEGLRLLKWGGPDA